jgi:hypothetical protein
LIVVDARCALNLHADVEDPVAVTLYALIAVVVAKRFLKKIFNGFASIADAATVIPVPPFCATSKSPSERL